MESVKIIKSEMDHELALARLMELMDVDPEEGSLEADELELSALVIENYEESQFPMTPPDPIEAIKFRMDQMSLKNKDLIPYIGSASKVSEVLNRKRSLSLTMIRKISDGLGISADVLIREPFQKLANQNNIQWLSFPLSEMLKRGYFSDFSGSLNELREYAAEIISKFLSSVIDGFELQPALLRSTAHLRSNDKEVDQYALWAWQVRILQKAQNEKLNVRYDASLIDEDWLKRLVQLSWSEKGPQLAKEYLNQNGIHLMIEPHLPKTYLDGAVCFAHSGHPVVALTLRHDRLDNFWFSLIHELAHLKLHFDRKEAWFLDNNLDAEASNLIEKEADELARNILVQPELLNALPDRLPATIREISKKHSISPCILAGRLRYDNKDHKLFGRLFRDKVKDFFD